MFLKLPPKIKVK